MIQRAQSIYLTFIIMSSLFLLSGGILSFKDVSGNAIKLSTTGILTEQNQNIIAHVAPAWLLASFLILICLLSLVAVFMFRVRKIQMLLTMSVIVLSSVLFVSISWFGFTVIHDFKMSLIPGLKMAFPVLILIFSILAFRGIRKDEQLVKSYDRLR